MDNKKRQLYQLFGELGITEEKFKEWFYKWVYRYEHGDLKVSPEDFLPKIPKETEHKVNEYIKGEHTIREMFDYLENLYMDVLLDKELARETALSELIFRIMKPSELLYLVKNAVEKPKNKA